MLPKPPTQTTAITGGQTTTQYDPLGRPVRSVGPTGIVTTTSYAFTATGTTTVTTETAGSLSRWTQSDTDGLGRVVRTETPGSGNQHPVALETDTLYLDATLDRGHDRTALRRPGRPRLDRHQLRRPRPARRHRHADGSTAASQLRNVGRLRHHPDRRRRRQQRHHPLHRRLEQPRQSQSRTPLRTRASRQPSPTPTTCSASRPASPTRTATPRPRTWNMLGQKTADNDPDRGATTYHDDPAGNLTQTQDARGRVTTMQYDALNRLTASTDTTTGQHRDLDLRHRHAAPDTGQLTAETDPSAAGCPGQVSHRWTYNLLGAVTQQTQCTSGLTATITTSYDALGEPVPSRTPTSSPSPRPTTPAGHLTAIPGLRTGHQLQRRRTARQYHLRQPHHRQSTATTRPAAGSPGKTSPAPPRTQPSSTRPTPTTRPGRSSPRAAPAAPGARLHLQHARRTHRRHRRGHRPEHADPHLRRPRQHRNQQQRRHLHLPRQPPVLGH